MSDPSHSASKKAKVGADGLTKQQRYRLKHREEINARSAKARREARAKKRQEHVLEPTTPPPTTPPPEDNLGHQTRVLQNSGLKLKYHIYSGRLKAWQEDCEDVLDTLSMCTNLRTGWTNEEPYKGSCVEEAVNEYHKSGLDLSMKIRRLLQDLATEIPYYEDSEMRWIMMFDGHMVLLGLLQSLEMYQLSFEEQE
ncbi:hypothetical protein CPC08DRAFT_763381 [Agrocybe pediades]|nr:hypothetical protein CPC08DRAFT_763381 [Agrocybe pediades]